MTVLVYTKVNGQTTEGYDGVSMAVKDSINKAPGFIMHCAFPVLAEDSCRLHELWHSKEETVTWYAKYVGLICPKRSYQQLHTLIK